MPKVRKDGTVIYSAAETRGMDGTKKPGNLLRVNDSMIHDIKGQDGRKAVTVGLKGQDNVNRVGTIYVGASSINPDKHTAHLQANQQKSYVAISPKKTYDFVTSVKNPEGKFDRNVTKISGQTILDQNKAYMKERHAEYAKQAEAKAADKAKQAEGVQSEAPQMG